MPASQTQLPFQKSASHNYISELEQCIEQVYHRLTVLAATIQTDPMYVKEIDDPHGWKRPDSGYIPWWYGEIAHLGKSPYHLDPQAYDIFRNVKDYGAVGDGITLDDDAIQKAMTAGGRCSQGCGSSTTQNAVVYFPPGTYLLSRPIQSYYGTSLVGDVNWRPVLKAAPQFNGTALVDEDPYDSKGQLWWINQVNFFRQTRNIVFDVRDQENGLHGTGIHRPTSQATALSNCHFEASRTNPDTQQQGILMEAGSGGNMGNLTFRGGQFGLSIGNQQFTVTDLRFEGQTKAAINVFWSWTMNFQNVEVRDTPIGLLAPTNFASTVDAKGSGQNAASILMVDWRLQNVGRALAISSTNSGVFTIENLRALHTPVIVSSGTGNASADAVAQQTVILAGETASSSGKCLHVAAWTQGAVFEGDRAGRWTQGHVVPAQRPDCMTHRGYDDGRWFTRSRPEYEDLKAEHVIDVKKEGAKGDGITDDTRALQHVLDKAKDLPDSIIFIPHGTYIVKSTLLIHPGTRLVGEAYSVLMGAGPHFNDMDNPKVVFRFGLPPHRRRKSPTTQRQPRSHPSSSSHATNTPADADFFSSDSDADSDDFEEVEDTKRDTQPRWSHRLKYGRVEVSDIVFSTRGPAAGAIVVEWNLPKPDADSDPALQGSVGLWDAHVRLGGLHASIYMSGTWVWLADHDLDRKTNSSDQITVYSGRGVLVENTKGGPVWMYGVGSEHHLLHQFNLYKAKSVLMSIPQTETAYFQGNGWPAATETQPPSADYHDPLFRITSAPTLNNSLIDPAFDRGIALRIRKSKDVIVYGPGLYSFFNNYSTDCSQKNGPCQRSIVSLERIKPDANVAIMNLNTVGTDSMLDLDHVRIAPTSFWRNGFTATIARWTAGP
ncbi:hypothetical protein OC846_006363 [Tilletia horrida]|uniref:Rhamnogalacturonase A/B/Epimerase-like pectate lyase domain-containing protein n=1 Tax=Tilletia horrida TaxID=155126 RepID=A0AAN6GIT7_9BASI|nr:hypothetical protein OC846_006363 [Tilletia horrida]